MSIDLALFTMMGEGKRFARSLDYDRDDAINILNTIYYLLNPSHLPLILLSLT